MIHDDAIQDRESAEEPAVAEFGVAGVESHDDGISVTGRCHRGPLNRGDVFRRVRISTEKGSDEHILVELKVEEITAYGRELDQIDEGLTARLRLAGRVTSEIPGLSVLSTS